MRRPTFALTSALAVIGLSASAALAQQQQPRPQSPGSSVSADSIDPMMATRAPRYLLRNGMDYLTYREYDRALSFFHAVEARKSELSDAEVAQLKKGIAKAQEGKREAINSAKVVAVNARKSRPAPVQPGAFALAPAANSSPDAVQLTSGTIVEPAPAPAPALAPVTLPMPGPTLVLNSAAGPAPIEVMPDPVPVPTPRPSADPAVGLELPTLPGSLPDLAAPPVEAPSPPPVQVPMPTPMPSPAAEPSLPLELPTLPTSADPVSDPLARPARVVESPMPLPEVTPPVQAPADAMPPQVPSEPQVRPMPVAEPVPAPEAPPASEAPPMMAGEGRASSRTRRDLVPKEILSPRLRDEVDRLAQRPTDAGMPGESPSQDPDSNASAAPPQGSTRLDLPRAPSPTEARPLRKIPVPEEFVRLDETERKWDPARKYWAAAGTCHMTLYFQDPVLERYGQSAEQSLGPVGRYLSYPLDDPKQSNQRNQILQPFYSMGKFAFQVGTLPYKLVVDPPWEAEYDLGYYRPGDRIPTDTIMITPYGVGPPLKGRNY